MKKLITCLLFYISFLFCSFSQTKSIEIFNYKYRAFYNNNSWNWIGGTYYYSIKRKFDLGFGLGYNITPVFIKETLFYSSHPRNKNVLNNLTLNVSFRKHLNLNVEHVDLYLFEKLNMGKTSFYQTSLIFQDSTHFTYINTYSNPHILLDNTLGVGLDVKMYKDLHFFTKIGVCFWYTQSNNFNWDNFRISKEFGLKYDLNNLCFKKDKIPK